MSEIVKKRNLIYKYIHILSIHSLRIWQMFVILHETKYILL
jgi:hypothetical protein